MWTIKNRARYDRSKFRYPSDLTDDERALTEPLIPSAKCGRRRRTVVMRQVVNGLRIAMAAFWLWGPCSACFHS
jgi:transposase